MLIFLWKLSRHSTCIRSLDSVFTTGLRVQQFAKMIPYTRRTYGDYVRNSVDSYDYGHKAPTRGRLNSLSVAATWEAKELPVFVNCGQLRASDANQTIHMSGRVQFQSINRFVIIRDSHGTTQLVIPEERLDIMRKLRSIPFDSHIEVIGTVKLRPLHTVNSKMETGDIEVILDQILDVFTPKRKLNERGLEDASLQTAKKPRSLLMTSEEMSRCVSSEARKKFQQRTHNCGELKESDVGSTVTLSGWIDSKRSKDNFCVLRDGYGGTQLVLISCGLDVANTIKEAQVNTLVTVTGCVSMRPASQRNYRVSTGNIEIKVQTMEIIDPNAPDAECNEEETKERLEAQPSGPSTGGVNSYCMRTHTCNELQASDVGKEVVLCGWLASQRTKRFAIIRDGHGTTQLLIPPNLQNTIGLLLSNTPLESVIMVSGTVCGRPPEQFTDLAVAATGEIEVMIKELKILNLSKRDLPFVIREHNRPKENLRMKYRYLDLRFKDMQFRLRLRSKILMKMREFLINQRGFVEVETPTLFRRTPGGAQEYVVPTRIEDMFYSLVQSPQQLKQLLMIGCMDRYFQVARCYRDEGARPDRQPEFTQMDIELSFTNKDYIIALIEDLLKASFPPEFTLHTPFPVMTYKEAMHWYGSDKPDLRFDKKLSDITDIVENYDFLPENVRDVKGFTAKTLFFDNSSPLQKLLDAFRDCEDLQKLRGDNRAKLIMVRCNENNWSETVKASLPFVDPAKLLDAVAFPLPSTLVVGLGQEDQVLPLMGKLRSDMFSKQTSDLKFAWIVDFPLFLEKDDGTLESSHHPFTAANEEDAHLLDSEPLKVRGLHFDLVLNGYEVGGGSVRIHDPVIQAKVLTDILKIPTTQLQHLLEALASGAPPHGGIALGIDRLMSILVRAESIRDVIAFPKGVDGKDPLCGAPCSISDEEKKLYHLIPRSPIKPL